MNKLGANSLLEDPFEWQPSPECEATLREVFKGLTLPIVDHHCHVAGMQEECTGCYVHPSMSNLFLHPVNTFQKKAFLSALGGGHISSDHPDLDLEVARRHAKLARHLASVIKKYSQHAQSSSKASSLKMLLLPFDCVVDKNGEENREKTGLHVPQSHVENVARLAPEIFVPACSIHPYRKDCVERLRACHAKGVRMIKWLPNSMRIDVAHPLCDKFYHAVRELDMTILVHTGEERSVVAGGVEQEFGNPLRLRRPLKLGVRVLAAHCASEGSGSDLDLAPDYFKINPSQQVDPEQSLSFESLDQEFPDAEHRVPSPRRCDSLPKPKSKGDDEQEAPVCPPALPKVGCFELLKRLFDEPAYQNLIYSDISALECFRRVETLVKVLADAELLESNKLVHGTDYPVPALNVAVHTNQLVRLKLITASQREIANECYRANPMLFDVVLKRMIRGDQKEVAMFPDKLFGPHDKIDIGTFVDSQRDSFAKPIADSSSKSNRA